MASVESGPKTHFVGREIRLLRPKLVILTGAKKGTELSIDRGVRMTIGSASTCEIVLPDLADRHAEIELAADGSGIRVFDRSDGGTRLNGSTIKEAILEAGGTLDLAGVEIRLSDGPDTLTILPSTKETFGPAKGRSLVMREVFGVLEAVAETSATVLLLGETGTGKDVIAHAIHEASPRNGKSMLTLDCGAIAPTLIESELFGHERGAFTGAEDQRIGAFERAAGGTLFLDEIGELPVDMQPKLLRAIDEREVQRVGGAKSISVDVRIIAATKRDLEEEVKRGRFRQDLFFRLAIVPITLPPLRDRREDIPLLVEHFLAAFEKKTGHSATIDPNEVPALLAHEWPGNVRELKNTVERALWLAQTGDGVAHFMLPTALSAEAAKADPALVTFDGAKSFSEHKQSWEEEFERRYLAWLLARADGSISKAARLASMDRKHLRGLLRKHGLVSAAAQEG